MGGWVRFLASRQQAGGLRRDMSGRANRNTTTSCMEKFLPLARATTNCLVTKLKGLEGKSNCSQIADNVGEPLSTVTSA